MRFQEYLSLTTLLMVGILLYVLMSRISAVKQQKYKSFARYIDCINELKSYSCWLQETYEDIPKFDSKEAVEAYVIASNGIDFEHYDSD